MEQSIMKNIQELSELCVDYGITNGGKVLVDLIESEEE